LKARIKGIKNLAVFFFFGSLLQVGVASAEEEVVAPVEEAVAAPVEEAVAAPVEEATAAPVAEPEEEVETKTFNRELLTVEEQVNSMKERVFRAKATLQLLKEIVVQGSSSGSRATVWHQNKLGNAYTMESLAYYLDGQGKFAKNDPDGSLDTVREVKVFEGAVPPGNHNLTVQMHLRGNGFGMFSYVENYTFNVQASTAFVAEEGKSCIIKVKADERKGIGQSFTERPNVTFEINCMLMADIEEQ